MKKGIIWLLFLLAVISIQIMAQERIEIPLEIDLDYKSVISSRIDFNVEDEEKSSSVVAEVGETKYGYAKGNVRIKATRLDNWNNSYLIKVDTDGDLDFKNELEYEIFPDSAITINAKRNFENGSELYLPYRIEYDRYRNWWKIFTDGFLNERLSWGSNYRTKGKISLDSCETIICLTDLNNDGYFDSLDTFGTNLSIDSNNDGKIWGRNEHYYSSEIINYCNKNYIVDSIASDGSYLALLKYDDILPEIGKEVPYFSYRTLNGKLITPENLKGEVYLLDYWASWCGKCVAKFPLLQELEKEKFKNKIKIFTINVDKASRVNTAHKILNEYNIKWDSVIEGVGQEDFYWKKISTIGNHRTFSIPLYVLIDKNGIIQYADYGGENLADLETKILELL